MNIKIRFIFGGKNEMSQYATVSTTSQKKGRSTAPKTSGKYCMRAL